MEAQLMQLQSLCIVVLMIAGIKVHKNRKLHVKIMSFAMIWDVILILQIELSRSAILKASKAVTNSMALNIHVSIAVLTVIFYGFMIQSGRAVLSGNIQLRKRHKILGYSTTLLRILTFITSFWAVTPKG
jgi:hypothetical protein